MDLNKVKIPASQEQILDVIYQKAKRVNPELTESLFVQIIFDDWLRLYKLDSMQEQIPKGNVKLRNNVAKAIKAAGKTQTGIAKDIGINRSYLNEVINGKSEPSITVAFLIAKATGYPFLNDLFFLEPVP